MNKEIIQEDVEIIQKSSNSKIKVFQIIIILILLITAFYAGKLSMSKQIYALFDRIYQLETQISEIQ